MKIDDLKSKLSEAFQLEKISENVYKLETGASFINGHSITLLIENKNNKWFLTDGKNTMKYMNDLYELKSSDVKMCISNVLKIYGFSISSGLMHVEIPSADTFMDKVFDMIMCTSQLANMFAFFDKP